MVFLVVLHAGGLDSLFSTRYHLQGDKFLQASLLELGWWLVVPILTEAEDAGGR